MRAQLLQRVNLLKITQLTLCLGWGKLGESSAGQTACRLFNLAKECAYETICWSAHPRLKTSKIFDCRAGEWA